MPVQECPPNLETVFDTLNLLCFEGSLSRPPLYFSPDYLGQLYGWYTWWTPAIYIQSSLIDDYSQLCSTMLHEMVHHAGYWQHSPGFYAALRAANTKLTSKPELGA